MNQLLVKCSWGLQLHKMVQTHPLEPFDIAVSWEDVIVFCYLEGFKTYKSVMSLYVPEKLFVLEILQI
jgi:hypothetical protein